MSHAAHYTGEHLTLTEFDAIPEDNTYRYEVDHGVLQVNARPIPAHQRAAFRLLEQLNTQLPDGVEALPEIDLVLGTDPLSVRIPDVFVGTDQLRDERRAAADEAVLVVEIVSPGSFREDFLIKPRRYAAAGIPHLWVISIEPQITLAPYRLIGDNPHYYPEEPLTGVAELSEPWPLRLDLDALVGPRKGNTP